MIYCAFYIVYRIDNNLSKASEFIEETNRGHQMLVKMGWAGTGTGLGSKNQGINQPILTGEQPRDRKDMYKVSLVNIFLINIICLN